MLPLAYWIAVAGVVVMVVTFGEQWMDMYYAALFFGMLWLFLIAADNTRGK